MTTAITALLTVPGIIGLTSLLRRLFPGLRGNVVSALALAAAVLLTLVRWLMVRYGAEPLWLQIEQAILMGLAAMGIYDITPGDSGGSGESPARADLDAEPEPGTVPAREA
ncbi:hypothetical protein [Propionibacterium australiense]|uniref:Uncharacterized protein n=1 Tax=Propionibacterium australiense TaxID=119981 RepID=A0A8B3FR56_9ACTN|nr:hypothetical protein [Propionibacterium australiense]RLP08918.1 hypothetical protein D7U36_08910 [Propionibacterium australiense]